MVARRVWVSVHDGKVSRLHATITARQGGGGGKGEEVIDAQGLELVLTDSSSTGVFVDGVKVAKGAPIALRLGARLQFGGPSGPAGTPYTRKKGAKISYSCVVEVVPGDPNLCLPDPRYQACVFF